MRSAAEARDYLVRLRQILRYIDVTDANLEEGNFRCDANVSLRPVGSATFGTKVEIKNMNSFRAVHDAILFEELRQAEILRAGGHIDQETRGWVDERGVTVTQRSKESAHDYRYFPEPDLPPLRLAREWVETMRARLPELPAQRLERLLALGLSDYEATTLTETRERADYYDAVRTALGDDARAAKLAANWVLGEALRWCNVNDRDIVDLPVTPAALAELIGLVEAKTITAAVGKAVFEKMAQDGRSAKAIVEAEGLAAIGGGDELAAIARQVIAENPKIVADYLGGKAAALGALIGPIMKATGGRANPQAAREILVQELQKNA
jgi:aspartyl-tRNA(Asn)/glutamyl-tRNA(Gln) amidotransferase subunit B